MNEKLIYKNGKALVISNGKKTEEVDYYDNLNKVLQKENLIENIDAKIFNLEQDIFADTEKKYTKKDFMSSFAIVALSPLGSYVILDYILDLEKIVSTTLFGNISIFELIIILGIPVVGIVGGIMIVPMFIKNKELKKVINGKKITLKYLKKELEKAKEELLELRRDKICTKNNKGMYVLSIKDDENTAEIKNNLNIYYSLGYYQEKNKRYFDKNKSNFKVCYPLLYGEILEDNIEEKLPKKRVRKK